MKILLHICCAPCAAYSIDRLKQDGHEVEGLFYNPNIHPFSEYLMRRESVRRLAEKTKTKVSYLDYDIERFFRQSAYNETAPRRCAGCWNMRLRKTARYSAEKEFDAFTTTLLISPYQKHDMLKAEAETVSKDEGASFHYVDFRPGFRESQGEAKRLGLYRQKYCGCVFSERDSSGRR